MKKVFVIVAAVLATICISCSKEEMGNVSKGTSVIKASLSSVKTVMGEKSAQNTHPVLWSETDVISVNGVSSNSIDVLSPASSADFVMSEIVTAPLCAIYPASAYVENSFDATTKKTGIRVPSVQNYTEGSFDPESAVMLGYSTTDAGISFHNIMAYLTITIQGGVTDEKIKSIVIKSRSGKPVSGEFEASFGSEECSIIIPAGESESTVTLDCGAAGIEQGVPMTIALPAQTYTGGLDIAIIDIRDRKMEVSSKKDLALTAGNIYPTTIAYSTEPVSFPVYFPLGYAADQIDGSNKSTSASVYSHASSQTLWRPSSNSTSDGIYIDNLQPQKGVFVSKSQPQATFKWHWVNDVDAYRPSGKTYRPFVEFSGGASGSTTLLAGPGIKGIWTGDYLEFDLPVVDFKAGTTLEFTFAVCNKNAPTFWEVKYLDGGEWKTTAQEGCVAPDGVTTATATWAIPYNYAPKLSTRMTFANAVAAGHILVRLVCVDGSITTSGINAVKVLDCPAGSTGCSANFYFCEKNAERNPDKSEKDWSNACIDQTQSISFSIIP